MTQTLADKLRIIADAEEAGDKFLFWGRGTQMTIEEAISNIKNISHDFYRLQDQIMVGKRAIKGPLKTPPEIGEIYYSSIFGRNVYVREWNGNPDDQELFEAANCWETEDDARVYGVAALAVRKGEA